MDFLLSLRKPPSTISLWDRLAQKNNRFYQVHNLSQLWYYFILTLLTLCVALIGFWIFSQILQQTPAFPAVSSSPYVSGLGLLLLSVLISISMTNIGRQLPCDVLHGFIRIILTLSLNIEVFLFLILEEFVRKKDIISLDLGLVANTLDLGCSSQEFFNYKFTSFLLLYLSYFLFLAWVSFSSLCLGIFSYKVSHLLTRLLNCSLLPSFAFPYYYWSSSNSLSAIPDFMSWVSGFFVCLFVLNSWLISFAFMDFVGIYKEPILVSLIFLFLYY